MYMTLRTVQAVPGRVGDLIEVATRATQLMNERYGSDYTIAIQVGGNPDLVGASAGWETLGAYQTLRERYMADDEIVAEMARLADHVTASQDQIARVLLPPGERSTFTALNQARMHMPRVAEALPFCLEVAEFVESKVGLKVGVANATTGDRSMMAWIGRNDSLDEMAEIAETLEADPEYLELYKRSGGLLVDGSLEQNIWQRVS